MNETPKRMLFGLAVLPALMIGLIAAKPQKPELSVMTRNLYFGGDLMVVARATDLDSFMTGARALLTDVALSNFPDRAQGIARQVEERQPDVIGLQEVYNLQVNGENGPAPFVNYLDEVLNALAARDLDYVVVASVQDMHVTVPIDINDDGEPEWVSLTDHDVILVRAGLVEAGKAAPVEFSSLCPRPSLDGGPGCNYLTYAEANLPFASLAIERGFVGVDVDLNGTIFRVVNTHLEEGVDLDPTNPLAPAIQAAQATELKTLLDATSQGVELLVVGDFNSSPDDALFPDPANGPFVPPYQQFTEGVDLFGSPLGAPYTDTWLRRPGSPMGYTCCTPDLSSPHMSSTMRIDLVFSSSVPANIKANLFDNNPDDKTTSGLWPSDHAGLFVRIWY